MKKSYIILIILAIVIISLFVFFKNSYNSMVTMSEGVASQWSNVEN